MPLACLPYALFCETYKIYAFACCSPVSLSYPYGYSTRACVSAEFRPFVSSLHREEIAAVHPFLLSSLLSASRGLSRFHATSAVYICRYSFGPHIFFKDPERCLSAEWEFRHRTMNLETPEKDQVLHPIRRAQNAIVYLEFVDSLEFTERVNQNGGVHCKVQSSITCIFGVVIQI